jgi:TonB family protein
MKRILVAMVLLAVAGASAALTTGGSAAYLDQRIAELDGALLQLRVELADGRVTEAQKADVLALQRSLEAERALLAERKAVLMRLEPQAAAAPAPASGSVSMPVTPAPAVAPAAPPASVNPLAPLHAPRIAMPDAACQRRLAGWVALEFAILPDGSVADVKVTQAEPAGTFDAAASAAVAARTYPARPLPIKMKEKMFMSVGDCRAEQLRAEASAGGETCSTLAMEARAVAAPFTAAESGRAVLSGPGAQVFSAPSLRCEVEGKRLKPGTRLEARMEFKSFSLVATPKGTDEMWVRSNQLKDTAPLP